VIEAEEVLNVATCDIPNAFIQTQVEEKDKDESRTIMKIRGKLIDVLCKMDPVYGEHVIIEKSKSY
jgi:hypothetical protein